MYCPPLFINSKPGNKTRPQSFGVFEASEFKKISFPFPSKIGV
jgi:hypothetical protein